MKHIKSMAFVSILLVWASCIGAEPPIERPDAKDWPVTRGPYEKLKIVGEPARFGIYDPSIEYVTDGSVGWLAYSAAQNIPGRRAGPNFSTHIARSTDHGKTWTYQATAFQSRNAEITRPDGSKIEGLWHYEVATIVHDPQDLETPWKLFAHRMFAPASKNPRPGANRMFQYSWIVYSHAKDPAGPWAPEVEMFRSGLTPPPPHNTARVAINSLDPSLANVFVYSEPGTLVHDGVLYVCLDAVRQTAHRVVLIASDDHGKSWRFVGDLLTDRDAEPFGLAGFSGASMFSANGKNYLLAAFRGDQSKGQLRYEGGCLIEIEDITRAKVRRNTQGHADILVEFAAQKINSGTHGAGQSTYHRHNHAGGLLYSQMNVADLPEFAQVFRVPFQASDLMGE